MGHHFAAIFEFGYKWGAASASVVAFAMEYWQGLDDGIMNTGDIALGEAAAQIGADLKSGNISMGDVPSLIRNTLCAH